MPVTLKKKTVKNGAGKDARAAVAHTTAHDGRVVLKQAKPAGKLSAGQLVVVGGNGMHAVKKDLTIGSLSVALSDVKSPKSNRFEKKYDDIDQTIGTLAGVLRRRLESRDQSTPQRRYSQQAVVLPVMQVAR